MDIDNSTIVAVGALLVAAISVFLAIRKGGDAERAVTVALEALQANRVAMDKYESMYQASNSTVRAFVDAFAGVIEALAPLTPIGADDKLSDVLEDVRTPGPPVPPKPIVQ